MAGDWCKVLIFAIFRNVTYVSFMLLGDFDKKHLKFFTYVHEILGSLLLVWFHWFCLPRKFSSLVSLLYLILTAVRLWAGGPREHGASMEGMNSRWPKGMGTRRRLGPCLFSSAAAVSELPGCLR